MHMYNDACVDGDADAVLMLLDALLIGGSQVQVCGARDQDQESWSESLTVCSITPRSARVVLLQVTPTYSICREYWKTPLAPPAVC